MSERKGHPPEIRADIEKAKRLEWWNIGWSLSVVIAMGFAMGGSQAMKTAWVEDTLGLVSPLAFLGRHPLRSVRLQPALPLWIRPGERPWLPYCRSGARCGRDLSA